MMPAVWTILIPPKPRMTVEATSNPGRNGNNIHSTSFTAGREENWKICCAEKVLMLSDNQHGNVEFALAVGCGSVRYAADSSAGK